VSTTETSLESFNFVQNGKTEKSGSAAQAAVAQLLGGTNMDASGVAWVIP
jgi:hypothetical protein